MTSRHPFSSSAIEAAKKTRKRLFVLCDGTWQDGVNRTRPLTNVATLARCLAPIDNDGCLQIVYYDSGVGNRTSAITQLIDGATGRGISAKIRNAYSFLSHNYNFDNDWDEIILVGYSRGAFAVQCLAALINDAGLLQKQHLYYLRGLFTLWSNKEIPGVGEKFRLERDRLQGLDVLHQVKITACATWDTVSSLGTRFQIPPRPLSFVGKILPSCVGNAFQALALDEARRDFRPVVWEGPREKTKCIAQCWFLGSHNDVGGNGDAALGMLTFLWMVGMLQDKIGVTFSEEEIVRHLKHKFLEWNFTVNRLFRIFKEKRTFSSRPHSGTVTPARWYWRLLGQSPRATLLRQPCPLPTEIHFTVRLTMAQDKSSSQSLRSWSTSWTNNTDDVQAKIQWHLPGVASLNENLLDKDGTEHGLLFRWSHGEFPNFPTDRGRFAQIQEPVQAPGTDPALDKFKDLLREKMEFGNEGKLAEDVLYQGQ